MGSTLLAPQADTRFDPGALMREWHVRLDKPDNADALNQQRLLRLLPLLDARGQEDVADVIYALVRELAGMNASAAKDPLSPMVFPDQAGLWAYREAIGKPWELVDARDFGNGVINLYALRGGWGGYPVSESYTREAFHGEWLRVPVHM